MRGQNAALGRISHYKKDPRLLEGDDYALSARLLCRSSEFQVARLH